MLFYIAATPFWLQAQVIINVQLPPGGMVQKEQLWNLTLVNNVKDFTEVNIKLTLQDPSSGQVLMSANSGYLPLSKGVKVITYADIQPVFYNYYTQDFSAGLLPAGAYIACYGIYYTRGESEEFINEDCVNFIIDPLSPPLLSAPADKDTIQTPYPSFNWVPPTPLTMFGALSYDIIVTEVLEGQSSVEAVENNTPVYSGNNLTQPTENYPASFSKLENGKLYAWQVIAKNGSNYSAKTDVWTFIVSKITEPVSSLNNNYLTLENDLKDTYIIANKQLQIKYTSFDAEHEAPIVFSDLSGNKIMTVTKKIVEGDNYFTVSLGNRFQKGIIYTVTITDVAGKSQAILIRIK